MNDNTAYKTEKEQIQFDKMIFTVINRRPKKSVSRVETTDNIERQLFEIFKKYE